MLVVSVPGFPNIIGQSPDFLFATHISGGHLQDRGLKQFPLLTHLPRHRVPAFVATLDDQSRPRNGDVMPLPLRDELDSSQLLHKRSSHADLV